MLANARICQARMRVDPARFISRQLGRCAAVAIELLALGSLTLALAAGLILLAGLP